MATTKKQASVEFDPSKLERLQEPITVTVVKLANGQREPVVLPTKPEEQVPGKGWLKDDILQIDEFLGNKWVGAGTYELVAAGANGETMKWRSYFPESKYPSLHQGEPIARPMTQAPQTTMGSQLGGSNGGWLGGMPMPHMQPPLAPWSPGGNGAQNWLSWQVPPWQARQTPWTPQSQGHDDRVQQEREERLKLEAKLERERLETTYKERLGGLGSELADLKRLIAQPKGESEETKLLKEQIHRLEQQRSDDKFAAMVEASNQSTREMIQAVQAQTREMFQQLQQQMNAQPRGPDPTMMLLVETMKASSQAQMESSRAQAEAQKEIARMNAEVQRESSRNALGPQQLLDIMRSSSIGQEQLASAYSKVWELMQQGLETVLAAQGPAPNPALELVGQAAQGGLEVAQRYVAMKERSAVAAAQAQAASAQAHAQAQAAAAQAAAQQPALAGAPEEEDEEEDEEIRETEEELFGPALPHVIELRNAVAAGAVKPAQAGQAIIGGIDQLATAGVHVPVIDLWANGNLAELVEVVLPDASTAFVEQTIQAIFETRNQMLAQAQQAQVAASQIPQ